VVECGMRARESKCNGAVFWDTGGRIRDVDGEGLGMRSMLDAHRRARRITTVGLGAKEPMREAMMRSAKFCTSVTTENTVVLEALVRPTRSTARRARSRLGDNLTQRAWRVRSPVRHDSLEV